MRSFLGRDILSLKEFERNEFFRVFEIAERLEPIARNRRNSDLLKEKTLVTAFYQPSTRTRLAHEAAMHRLGGHVTGFSDAKMTRAGDWYQESIKDTVKMLEYYGDVIVMRHFHPDRPVHGLAGKRPHRWPEMDGSWRYAHAHDAFFILRSDPIRLPNHLCGAAGNVAHRRVQGGIEPIHPELQRSRSCREGNR